MLRFVPNVSVRKANLAVDYKEYNKVIAYLDHIIPKVYNMRIKKYHFN